MKFHNRGFLNQSEGIAAFEYYINVDDENSRHSYLSGEFTISDCSRQVCLDFGIFEEKDIEDKLEKVQLLIRELCIFKKQLGMAAEVFREQEARKGVEDEKPD